MLDKFAKPGEALPMGLAALAEVHARDEAAGLDPMHTPVISDGKEQGPRDAGLVIPPPDWGQEDLQCRQRERDERAREAQARLERKLETEQAVPVPTPPA